MGSVLLALPPPAAAAAATTTTTTATLLLLSITTIHTVYGKQTGHDGDMDTGPATGANAARYDSHLSGT